MLNSSEKKCASTLVICHTLRAALFGYLVAACRAFTTFYVYSYCNTVNVKKK